MCSSVVHNPVRAVMIVDIGVTSRGGHVTAWHSRMLVQFCKICFRTRCCSQLCGKVS